MHSPALLLQALSLAREHRSDVVGVEHLLAAALGEDSACAKALRRSGVRTDAVLGLGQAQNRETPMMASAERTASSSVAISKAAQEFLARAAGVAAAFGHPRVTGEHLVVALIWTDLASSVQRLLQDVPGGRPKLAEELRAAGVRVPESNPPPWPKWGKRLELSAEEAELQVQSLQDRGQHFLFNWQDGKAILIVADEYESR